MKLNLGCGTDVRPGYTNVDFRSLPGVDVVHDLSHLPWPWPDGCADEVMMHDFLEHFPFSMTKSILMECWRMLRTDGLIDVQVPDFAECARAAMLTAPWFCNRCGDVFDDAYDALCESCTCGQKMTAIVDAAILRLYGGQDYAGNFHQTAFTDERLSRLLREAGFGYILYHEFNQNGETYRQNWNMRVTARKIDNLWEDE